MSDSHAALLDRLAEAGGLLTQAIGLGVPPRQESDTAAARALAADAGREARALLDVIKPIALEASYIAVRAEAIARGDPDPLSPRKEPRA